MTRITQSMITAAEHVAQPQRRRVRVWFGSCPICDYLGDPKDADRYEDAMRRRFTGLRVTNDPVPPASR